MLGHCKNILSMGNLEGKLLWNIVGIHDRFKYLHKIVIDRYIINDTIRPNPPFSKYLKSFLPARIPWQPPG